MESHSALLTAISMLGAVFGFIVSTLLVVRQMKDTQRWNRTKNSEEVLTRLIIGEFPALMDRLVLEYKWDILSRTPYHIVAARMDDDNLTKLDVLLRNILRHLEVISINMKHGTVDEDLCFTYMRSIMTTFFINCEDFILKERERRHENRVFTNTEEYARRWMHRIEQERQKSLA